MTAPSSSPRCDGTRTPTPQPAPPAPSARSAIPATPPCTPRPARRNEPPTQTPPPKTLTPTVGLEPQSRCHVAPIPAPQPAPPAVYPFHHPTRNRCGNCCNCSDSVRSEGGVQRGFSPLAGGLGALPPVSKGRAGGDQRHLPYRDYAGGEDISKSEQLPNCSVLVRHAGITLLQAAECGLCKGPSPFAGSLRACPESVEGVSLRYKLPPLPCTRKGPRKIVAEDSFAACRRMPFVECSMMAPEVMNF